MHFLKKALFIGHYPNTVEPYLRSFFQSLVWATADLGVDCTVIAPVSLSHYRGNITKIEKKQIEITPGDKKIRVFHPRYISYSSKSIGIIKTGYFSEKAFQRAVLSCYKKIDESFDYTYGHFFLTGGLAAVRVGRLHHVPSFIAYGECDYETQVRCDYGSIRSSDIRGLSGIISVSSKNTNELQELGIAPGIPVLTVPNATDLSLFYKKDKVECRKKFGIPQDLFVVGFVGGFIERKGDKRLLAAINQLDGVYGAFAGKGDNPPRGEKVLFCKPLDHSMICDFLNAIDVFCLPTLSEGSCNAIVEAMACGVPIISSKLPFNFDALDETNSILIDPLSVDDISQAIRELFELPEKRILLSKKSLEKAKDFDIKQRAAKILSFVNNIDLGTGVFK